MSTSTITRTVVTDFEQLCHLNRAGVPVYYIDTYSTLKTADALIDVIEVEQVETGATFEVTTALFDPDSLMFEEEEFFYYAVTVSH